MFHQTDDLGLCTPYCIAEVLLRPSKPKRRHVSQAYQQRRNENKNRWAAKTRAARPEVVWEWYRNDAEVARFKRLHGSVSDALRVDIRREAKMFAEERLLAQPESVRGGRSLYASAAEREQERKALEQLDLWGPSNLAEARALAAKDQLKAAAEKAAHQRAAGDGSASTGGQQMTLTPIQPARRSSRRTSASSASNAGTSRSPTRSASRVSQAVEPPSSPRAQIVGAPSGQRPPIPHALSAEEQFQQRVAEMNGRIFGAP